MATSQINGLKIAIDSLKSRCTSLETKNRLLETQNKDLFQKVLVIKKNIDKILQILNFKVSSPHFLMPQLVVKTPNLTKSTITSFTKGKPSNFALGTKDGIIQTFTFSSFSPYFTPSNQIELVTNKINGVFYDITHLISYEDGDKLIACSKSNTISPVHILEWKTLKILNKFEEHKEYVNVAIDIGNFRIASGGDDSVIKIWDVKKNKCIKNVNLLENSKTMCYTMIKMKNHKGIIASVKTIVNGKLWYIDTQNGKILSKLQNISTQFTNGLCEISEEKLAVAGDEDSIVIVNVERNGGNMIKERVITDDSISTGGGAFTFLLNGYELYFAGCENFGMVNLKEGANQYKAKSIIKKKNEFDGYVLILYDKFLITENNEKGLNVYKV